MQTHAVENPDLGYYFTHENILVFGQGVSLNDLVHQLMVNLAVTVGIGHILSTERSYIHKHHQYQLVHVSSHLSLLHFRITANDAMHISVGVVKENIHATPPPNIKPPCILALIVTPHNRPDLYYRAFSAFKTLAEIPNMPDFLGKAKDAMDIWEFINGLNLQLSPYVQAHQLMLPPRIAINDTDNLETAIDLLVNHRSRCLPVVDKDNELIGEVSLEEILQVCFPRHILWMDDISPILHFETFRNLLNNESVTWLTEILSHKIATVQLDDPAVKAAIEMTKSNTDHVYVLKQKTLVGIITLKNMAHMILRQ